jgi:hypothetical protein
VTANDTHSIDIEFNPVLDIVKDGPHTANVSDTVVYTFTVKHADTSDGSPVSDVTVSDDIAGPGNYVRGDTNTNHELDAGENWVYTATYTIQPTDSDPLTNTATVEGEGRDGNTVTAKDTHITRIRPPSALQIVKDGPATAKVGDIVVYTFTVSHADLCSGSPVSGVTVSDNVAGLASYVSGDTNSNSKLDACETWIYTAPYIIQPTDFDPLTNTATAEGEDQYGTPVTATDTHSIDIEFNPVLDIVKDGPTKAKQGDTVIFTFTITNDDVHGDRSPVGNISVSDSLVGPITKSPVISGDTDSLLEMDEVWVYTASYIVPSSTSSPIVSTATVRGLDRDYDSIVATDAHSFSVSHLVCLPVILKNYLPPLPCNVETFDDPNSGWPIKQPPPTLLEYLNGKYHMGTSDTTKVHWATSPLGPYSNYSVQVDINWGMTNWYADDDYGIVFDLSISENGNKYYQFNVNNDNNTYRLRKRENGKWIELIPTTPVSPSCILSGSSVNRLRIQRNDASIDMFINACHLPSYTDSIKLSLPRPGFVGVDISPSSFIDGDAYFDNFTICTVEQNGAGVGGLVAAPKSGVTSK